MDRKAATECRLKESDRANLLLEPQKAAAVLHFESCPACAEASMRQVLLFLALDAWKVPEVSASFNRILYAKIDAAMVSPWYERWSAALRQTFAQPAFAVAAVALVTIGGFLLDHPAGLTSRLTSATVQVSSLEAEQLERTLEDLEMLHQFDTGSEEKENSQKTM